MSRLFISHSSANNAAAIALAKWLSEQGYSDLYLDIDPDRGIAPGERWQEALKAAADRCEAVLFLVSPAWLDSNWCLAEFLLAKTLHKRVFGLIIEPVPLDRVPVEMTSEWQLCDLVGEDRSCSFEIDVGAKRERIAFREAGLDLLRRGLARAGLDAKSFPWPPPDEPKRAPYRGLRALEPQDAAIFFGRDAAIVRALDRIRGLVEVGVLKILVVLGASGSGKSSFLRAGLWPRLDRDDAAFLPLPVIRPQTAVISGTSGLVTALSAAFERLGEPRAPGRIKQALAGGAGSFRHLLDDLSGLAKRRLAKVNEIEANPAIILSLDQTEELFNPDGAGEARAFLELIAGVLAPADGVPAPHVLLIATVRSDRYELLQAEPRLSAIKQDLFNLPPLPPVEFKSVIEGPARRTVEAGGHLAIDPALTEHLVADARGADALPLLAFTLERLHAEYGGEGRLTLAHYEKLGGVQGSLEAAVNRALAEPYRPPAIPTEKEAQLVLLRAAFIPWLARIDATTGVPMRRVARVDEIPESSRFIVKRLVDDARLLVADRRSGVDVIEVAHESLLRQWPALRVWLHADAADLKLVEGVERAASEWARNRRLDAWLDHRGERLSAAEKLIGRDDFRRRLGEEGIAYLSACRKAETVVRRERRRVQAIIYTLLVGIIIGLVGWINQSTIAELWRWLAVDRPFVAANIWPYTLKPETEQALNRGDSFRECAPRQEDKDYCPDMVVVPTGEFTMGSPPNEADRDDSEGPQHKVVLTRPFAVSKFEVTFDEWDACVDYGDCDPQVSDNGWGRGQHPVINVTWNEARRYVEWFSKMTGKPYRLLSESEWEYAARAGTQTAYSWGDNIGKDNAHCDGCGSHSVAGQTAPAGSFPANAFGIFDMHGNVWEWVEDCYHANYSGAPTDGSPWTDSDCVSRVARGGSYQDAPEFSRAARRWTTSPGYRGLDTGFRVGRTLNR